MGACCFTPRRTQFLWWYWLVLATVVGIPMLLAGWYVARCPTGDEEQRRNRARKAIALFCAGAIASAAIAIGIGHQVAATLLGPSGKEFRGLVYLLSGYVCGISLALWLGPYLQRLTLVRLLVIMLSIAVAAFIILPMGPVDVIFGTAMAEPQQVSLLFAVCTLPSLFFRRFALTPTRKAAKQALLSAIVGALVFWRSEEYGKVECAHDRGQ